MACHHARTHVGLACAFVAIASALMAQGRTTTIADFENAAHDAQFRRAGNPTCAISAERASQGKRSFRSAFVQYEPGMRQWPNYRIAFGPLAAPADWRLYSEMLMDLYIESEADVLVKVSLRSKDKGLWRGARTVAPGKWTTLRFNLSEAKQGLDLRAVDEMALVLTRPPHPAVVYTDNIRVRAFGLDEPESVALTLVAPSYHNGFFHTKPEDRIAVRVERRTSAEMLGDGEFQFAIERGDGQAVESKTIHGRDLAEETLVTFPKPAMRDGEVVSFRTQAAREGKALWSKTIKLTQHPRVAQEVTLRDDGVVLINGEPFFPFGMYSSPVTEFGYLKQMGFNAVHSYTPVDRGYLDAAEEAGLRALPRLAGKHRPGSHMYYDPDMDPTQASKYIAAIKDSPALLGYYLFDEPNPGDCPREKLKALCDFVRRADPYHLAAGCNNSYQAAYCHVSDAMMVDSYPVPGPMRQLIARVREGAGAQAPNLSLWFIPQAFNYETHFAHSFKPRKHGLRRLPTFDEVRTMPWLGIALGAKGLFYYSFQTQGFYHRLAFPWFWRGFQRHVAETAALLPWLTERDDGPRPTCDNPAIFLAARRRGQDVLLVAANSYLEPQQARVTLPGLNGRLLHVVSEDRGVRPDGNTISETFRGMETHIYVTTLDEKLAALPTLDSTRQEVAQIEEAYRRANPSTFTYRDGARLQASWGFNDPEKDRRKIWYRMIDGFAGTPWVVGHAYRHPNPLEWRKKDFTSAGRWIEVRMPKPKPINRVRAVVTPGVRFQLQVFVNAGWRGLEAAAAPDDPPRHHAFASATTTAAFATTATDRFRIVFLEPRKDREVVFELAAWEE